MEDIRIPKLSILKKNENIFTDFKKFCAVTGYKPQNIPFEKKSKQSVFSKSSVFRSLRNSIINATRKDYNIIINEELTSESLLSCVTQLVLREKKKMLLDVIKKHEVAMKNVSEARIKCWKSKEKLDKYSLIVSKHKSEENKKAVRKKAMTKMESLLDKWKIEHDKHLTRFEKMFLQEFSLRELLNSISSDIASDICTNINANIAQLMDRNKQIVGVEEMNKLTKDLYNKMCRMYSFQIIDNSPCDEQRIVKPTHRCCEMKKKGFVTKTKSPEIHETVGQHAVDTIVYYPF